MYLKRPVVCADGLNRSSGRRRKGAFLLEDKMPKGFRGFQKGNTLRLSNHRLAQQEEIKIKNEPQYLTNQDKALAYNRYRIKANATSWEGFIPKKTNCQICGKKIYFNLLEKNNKNAIHFDHRKENLGFNYSPKQWLNIHPRNPENEKLWSSFGFGILCGVCNRYLPTKNRKEFIKKAVAYIFGVDYAEHL